MVARISITAVLLTAVFGPSDPTQLLMYQILYGEDISISITSVRHPTYYSAFCKSLLQVFLLIQLAYQKQSYPGFL
ncbi:hypothetical protein F4801DRAFT_544490 [Xylaria longipes]|nr:hypothetical protein F4801DRAFT_544490 [Xylaria longipes]